MSQKHTLIMILSCIVLLPSCWQQEQEIQQDAPEETAVSTPEETAVSTPEETAVSTPEEAPKKTPTPAPSRSSGKSVNLAELVNNKSEAPDILRKYVAQGKVVVDFHAKWCPPCKMMLPIIDELAAKYEDISFIKIDIDKFIDIANGFDVAGRRIAVSGVPAFYLFKNGKIVEEIGGGMAKNTFEQIMTSAFSR